MKLYLETGESCDINASGRSRGYVPRAIGRLLFSGVKAEANGKARTAKRYGRNFYLRLD